MHTAGSSIAQQTKRRSVTSLVVIHKDFFSCRLTTIYHQTLRAKSSPQILLACFEARICTLRTNVDAHARKSQHQYKRNYDCVMRSSTTYSPGEWIFVEQHLWWQYKNKNSQQLLTGPYNKTTVAEHRTTLYHQRHAAISHHQ